MEDKTKTTGNVKKLQIAKRHRVSQNQNPEITTKLINYSLCGKYYIFM